MLPLEFIIPVVVVIMIVLILIARANTPKGLLRSVNETLDPKKRSTKANTYTGRLSDHLSSVKERAASYLYEITLYAGEQVIAFVVVLLVAAGIACDGADVPLQQTFWRATLDQQSDVMIWALTIGTIIFFTVATFCALVVSALWTTMVPTWKRRSIILSVIGGMVVVLSVTALGAVRFVDPDQYAVLKRLTFWAQVALTEGLPITAGALHATAFLYGRPRWVARKKASLDRQTTEIEEAIAQMQKIASGPQRVAHPQGSENNAKGDRHETATGDVTVPADFLVGGSDADYGV